MKGFISKHPWMTFFLGLATLGVVSDYVAKKNVQQSTGGGTAGGTTAEGILK